jgi:hypothetical protein
VLPDISVRRPLEPGARGALIAISSDPLKDVTALNKIVFAMND